MADVLLFYGEGLPWETQQQLRRATAASGKAVLVGPVFDTIKLVERGVVKETLDRDEWRWPIAWACSPELAPAEDPPSAEWFVGAAVVEADSGRSGGVEPKSEPVR